jgi:hypothetical protein
MITACFARALQRWTSRICMHFRLTFQAVLDTSVLMVADRTPPEPTLGGMMWTWLEAVALERVPPSRGLAVVSHADRRRVQ